METVVWPAVRRMEGVRFKEQLGRLNNDGLIPQFDLVPLHQPTDLLLGRAPWGKTLWCFNMAWLVVCASGCIPLAVWAATRRHGLGSLPAMLNVCSLCGAPVVGLSHFLELCPTLLLQWQDLPQRWVVGVAVS